MLPLSAPAPYSRWTPGQIVSIKLLVADIHGVPISSAIGQALASACRVTFSATGADPLASQCMSYDAVHHVFTYNWAVPTGGKTGIDTISASITYADTTTTTTISEPITISRS